MVVAAMVPIILFVGKDSMCSQDPAPKECPHPSVLSYIHFCNCPLVDEQHCLVPQQLHPHYKHRNIRGIDDNVPRAKVTISFNS